MQVKLRSRLRETPSKHLGVRAGGTAADGQGTHTCKADSVPSSPSCLPPSDNPPNPTRTRVDHKGPGLPVALGVYNATRHPPQPARSRLENQFRFAKKPVLKSRRAPWLGQPCMLGPVNTKRGACNSTKK